LGIWIPEATKPRLSESLTDLNLNA